MAKLFKRDRIWYAWVRKRGGGVRKVSTLCTDKRAAEAVLAQLEREAADPSYAASKTSTQELLDEYTRSRVRIGRSDETLRYVRVKAGTLLRLLPKRAADILHARMLRYVDARLKEDAMRTTIRKELGLLKASLKLAKKNGTWQGDPDAVIPELDDDYEPRSRALTPWELVGLACVLPANRAALVVFIVATGARWGEAMRAQGNDFNETMTRWFLRGTKTKRARRWVPITGLSWGLLKWALGRHVLPFEPWLNVRRDLAVACKRLGIPPVTPNDLRRTFGTWLRAAGVEPQLIGAAMGHADSRMVERVYGRLTPEALGKLLEERTGRHGREEEAGGQVQRGGANPHDAQGRAPAEAGSEEPLAERVSMDPVPDSGGSGRAVLTGMHMGGAPDVSVQSSALSAEPDRAIPPGNTVRRDRIELSTRGFSGHESLFDEASVKAASEGARAVAEAYCWAIGGR